MKSYRGYVCLLCVCKCVCINARTFVPFALVKPSIRGTSIRNRNLLQKPFGSVKYVDRCIPINTSESNYSWATFTRIELPKARNLMLFGKSTIAIASERNNHIQAPIFASNRNSRFSFRDEYNSSFERKLRRKKWLPKWTHETNVKNTTMDSHKTRAKKHHWCARTDIEEQNRKKNRRIAIVRISVNACVLGYVCIYICVCMEQMCLVSDNDSNNDETTEKAWLHSSLRARRVEPGNSSNTNYSSWTLLPLLVLDYNTR